MHAGAAGILRSMTLVAEVLFFGDNTEFRNPYREGETIIGAAATLAVDIPLGERASLVAGAFGTRRYGSDQAFDLVRPVLTLRLTDGRSTLLMGTLSPPAAGEPAGPDRTGPHGMLPPLQRETLAFERPYEAGFQWTFAGATLTHDMWINWQRLNTPAHRERFDAGAAGEARITPWLAVPFQAHVVHEGGQLFASGPVADSTAMASGAVFTARSAGLDIRVETIGVLTRYVPDRDVAERFVEGSGGFLRAAAARAGWRGHVIVWRSEDFVKVEGDANYQSPRYAEAGLTRTFRPAGEVLVETSARLHRVGGRTEYSFRVLGAVRLRRGL
ncbi:MAG TPA: hypothetical protein VMN81_07310 [Vicinamibacterales bacterium]|nr:hypothetical protein [Vicinamibacterales bacterium]